ncbi:hypothetical protein L596_019095 [Steinernema carpocapsae]|uniref:PAP-associated domain-containing protein n=1 Tax=Steinernema carpocapsae TaxID=34508 RepID=A0A4U5N6U1_STECR|nr:hypothetical protein L596_019095 [Steinernema carpocapsae]
MFKKTDKIELNVQLTKQPVLSCIQLEVQLISSASEYNDARLLSGTKVNKKALMAAMKESFDVLKRIVIEGYEERRPADAGTEEIFRSCGFTPVESKKFPRAIFYCTKCDLHINTVPSGVNHAVHFYEHQVHSKVDKSRHQLRSIPSPSKKHAEAIVRLFKDCGSFDEAYGKVHAGSLISSLETILQRKFKECQVFLHGSHLTKCVGVESDINLTIVAPKVVPAHDLLQFLAERAEELRTIRTCRIVTHKYTPFLEFEYSRGGTVRTVRVSVNDRLAVLTDHLIALYFSIKPEFLALARIVRKWAEVSKVVNSGGIGVMKNVVHLMVVHFLQQRKLVPVLQGMCLEGRNNTPFDNWPEMQQQPYQNNLDVIGEKLSDFSESGNIGSLFLDFLRFYATEFDELSAVQVTQSAQLSRDSLEWRRKFIVIKDPYWNRNIYNMNKDIYVYVVNAITMSFVYFGTPRFRNGKRGFDVTLHTQDEFRVLSLLRRKKGKMARRELKRTKETSGDSPTMRDEEPNSNSSDEMQNGSVTELEPEAENGFTKNQASSIIFDVDLHDPEGRVYSRKFISSFSNQNGGRFDDRLRSLDLFNDPKKYEEWMQRGAVQVVGLHDYVFHLLFFEKGEDFISTSSAKDFEYTLDAKNFIYKNLSLSCSICQSVEHTEEGCPNWTNWDTSLSVNMSSPQKDFFSELTETAFASKRLKEGEVKKMYMLKDALEADIQRSHPNAYLSIFGSICTGFGTTGSDIDLCLRFADHPSLDTNCNVITLITQISKNLDSSEYADVQVVAHAKVPIIKFRHVPTGIDGDISIYNCLGIQNSDLLKFYCDYDKRIAPLGVLIKMWAKTCSFNNPSQGSLSSYALVIMLLHYLQRTELPVLPNLQELEGNESTCPQELLVEGYDTRFCRSAPFIVSFKNRQPHSIVQGGFAYPNESSLADLFVGFLDYFTRFDWSSNVVQIRRSENLTKVEKNWFDRPFCIEDPFKLHHNLSSAVNRNVGRYIMDTMCQTRQRMGELQAKGTSTFQDVQAFLDSCRLPEDRVHLISRADNRRKYTRPAKKKPSTSVSPEEQTVKINSEAKSPLVKPVKQDAVHTPSKQKEKHNQYIKEKHMKHEAKSKSERNRLRKMERGSSSNKGFPSDF